MRVYFPANRPALRALQETGELGPPPVVGYAVTPALREWYLDDDAEALEYAAYSEATRSSLSMLADDPAPRRMVIAGDVPADEIRPVPGVGRGAIHVVVPVPLALLAAVHIDSVEAEAAVRTAVTALEAAATGDPDARFLVDSVEEHELEWYDLSELDQLL